MPDKKNINKVSVLIVGAGPAGLASAIELKVLKPDLDVCVIDKAAKLGNHSLSGAVLEPETLHTLLDSAVPDWRDSEQAKSILANVIDKDEVMFLLGRKLGFNIFPAIEMGKAFGLGFGQMIHKGDYVLSISELTKWMGQIAEGLGAEVITGFAVEDIVLDDSGKAVGVKLVDQGFDKEGQKQLNYVEGETVEADFILVGEGCDGLITEKFIAEAGLQRQSNQLYSVGVKELVKVSPEQYEKFSSTRVVHVMGYPIWTPLLGPGMFGGGIVYAGHQDHIFVGMVVGADWKYCDFNVQDALTNFKNHSYVKKYLDGGEVVEAGAKMIPEGGYYAIPRDPVTGSIGKANVLILGDGAGFVDVLKIKGLHNAIDSGMHAAKAVAQNLDNPEKAAVEYTEAIEQSNVIKGMKRARNFRQTVARFGPLQGMMLSVFGELLPKYETEKDFEAMTDDRYILKPDQKFDKDTFTALAAVDHREEQPSHLTILDSEICLTKCTPMFGRPCITFCPAGVYETIHDQLKPANPSNCLHCKTCQRKCPFDNIRWTVPEGCGGPHYKRM